MIMGPCNVIMGPRNVNRGPCKVIIGPRYVVMGLCNVIMGPWDVRDRGM